MNAKMKGEMYLVGEYPAVIEGKGEIKGELMYLKPLKYDDVLRSLDNRTPMPNIPFTRF
ncbi:gamma-glutamylcyclotransferase [Chengkuizengella axinellae]|uniref:Uncharacterized protein n=1 Tax=Chengkuizengella axinellae TaxID=3064388 RepID=A0ABT9J2B4_9BACL|nr:gamma-glutamylcyclotransferase [Chengkuizengella sp. 2205SS18-9]MDP5275755.1 hypothetical protein [Chengkuizengella sp. 2205SS18-9]